MKTKNQDVGLALYSSKKDVHQKKVVQLVSILLSNQQVGVYTNITEFSSAIEKMWSGHGILLILVRDRDELDKIINQKDRLHVQDTILVLPDSNTYLMQRALKIYPRYLSYFQNDYQDVFLIDYFI